MRATGANTTADRARFVRLAVAAELGLGVLAVLWISWRDLPSPNLTRFEDLGAGLLVAFGLAVLNLGLLRYGPNIAPLRSIRRFYGRILRPLLGHLGPVQILVLSVAAGVGEELLFRGVVQPEWGLIPASVLFGIVHIGGADMVAFGVWAGGIGALLGWLAVATGGLLAPITAHAVYDALALAYIVWIPAAAVESDERFEEPPE